MSMNTLRQRCATLVTAAMTIVCLAACAPLPVAAPDGASLFIDTAFAPPSRPVEPAQVFALSAEMRRYLAHEIDDQVQLHGLQRGLIDALYTNKQLALDYDAEFTRNAAEAFNARAGNCLSLAIMTGAFAKALGLAVRYQAVQIDDSWGRDGDLALFVGHVNVSIRQHVPVVRTVEHNPDWWTVDFLPQADIKRQRTVPVGEERIVAMYLNNKAAEALARGRSDDAYWWIRAAITEDPHFADLYNTLGVVYMRRGLPQPAEAALRAALAQRNEHPQALSNLAVLLHRQGREVEAGHVDQQLVRLRAKSPFASFNRGLRAYEAGDYAQAREQFDRALAISNDFHEFHYWMALACLRLGERERAIRHLREAEQNSNTRQQQAAYAMKLQRLGAAGSEATGLVPMH